MTIVVLATTNAVQGEFVGQGFVLAQQHRRIAVDFVWTCNPAFRTVESVETPVLRARVVSVDVVGVQWVKSNAMVFALQHNPPSNIVEPVVMLVLQPTLV